MKRIEARPGTARALEGNGIDKLKSEEGWENKVEAKAAWVWAEEKGDSKEGRKRDEL